MAAKSQQQKRSVYVGGLADEVTDDVLRGVFVPFGDITDVQLPLDYETQRHRGFAFVEFETAEDAATAIDNMHEAELFGRTLRVNLARALRSADGSGGGGGSRAVWADDAWLQQHAGATLTEEEQGDNADTRLVSRVEPAPVSETRLPEVFLDLSVGGEPAGRVIIRLRRDVVPRTVENFRCLCTHERSFGFSGSRVHRVIPGFMVQAGDMTAGDGTGGRSIYGRCFADENFTLKHEPMCVAMANSGADSNGSQFYITTGRTDWLDGKHVVFGRVVGGQEVVRRVEAVGSKSGATARPVLISGCGELT